MTRTPAQTVGPYFSIGMAHGYAADLGGDVVLTGRVFDGDGAPVADAVLEIWQADHALFGRVATAVDGSFRVTTVRSAYLDVSVFARGLLRRLVTRVYFAAGEDPTLARVPPGRRHTLIARAVGGDIYEWNIVLQGADETVFFELTGSG